MNKSGTTEMVRRTGFNGSLILVLLAVLAACSGGGAGGGSGSSSAPNNVPCLAYVAKSSDNTVSSYTVHAVAAQVRHSGYVSAGSNP